MARRKYPKCAKCDAELNPNKWDDCEKYYLVGGEIYCKDCFKEWLEEWIKLNLDDVAELAGVDVVEVI